MTLRPVMILAWELFFKGQNPLAFTTLFSINSEILQLLFYYLVFKMRVIQIMMRFDIKTEGNDEMTSLVLRHQISNYVCKIQSFFIGYISALIISTCLRLMRSYFTLEQYPKQNHRITATFVIFYFFLYFISLYLIFIFFDTSMRFVSILRQEEDINILRARIVFGLVSVWLVIAKTFEHVVVPLY